MRAALLAFCITLAASSHVAAQNASAFIPPEHWVYSALRRLDALGWLPGGSDPGRRSIPQHELRALLDSAVARSSGHTVAEAYAQRFAEEFRTGDGFHVTDARVGASAQRTEGRALAGEGYVAENEWSGARIVADQELLGADLRAAIAGGPFAAAVSLQQTNEDGSLSEAHAVLASSALGAWAGRRDTGFGYSTHGAIALTNAQFDGGGVFLNRPLMLPSFLRYIGPIRLELHLTRVGNIVNAFGEQHRTDPWLHAARFSFEVHPRFRVGINRVMMFGGEGNEPVTFENVAKSMIGMFTTNRGLFANQLVSVDGTLRVPVSFPMLAYLEWGADDTAGGWRSVPALSGGLRLPMLPGVQSASLDVTGTWFSESCCGNAIWYRNHVFRGSWADDGVLLGHALGGTGRELAATLGMHAGSARLRVELTGLLRDRGDENVFAPQREGRSSAGRVSVAYRIAPRIEMDVAADFERGSGGAWSQSGLRARVRSSF